MNRKQRRGAQKIASAPPPDPIARMYLEAFRRHQAGALSEAQAAYERVLELRPNHVEAHYNLGLALQMQGKFEQAAACYRRALVFRPGHFDALANLGVALKDLGRLDEAETACRRAVAIDPASPRTLCNLGIVLLDQGKLEQAAGVLRNALAIEPDNHWSLANLIVVLERQENFEEAVVLGRRAIALRPDFMLAQFNLAVSLRRHGALDESIAAFTRVVALEPSQAEAHFSLGQLFLLRGDFARGWEEFEWRLMMKDYEWIHNIHGTLQRPRWSGEDIADKTIMICAEQGLGDTLQFVRYVPLVVARAGRVILMVQRSLMSLVANLAGVTLIGLGAAAPDFDVYCPLLSLPRLFATTPQTIPAEAQYLAADAAAVQRWRLRLGEGGLRVGIAWQGKPGTMIDLGRSFPLASFAPLSRIPGVRLISLQKNEGVEQLAGLPDSMRVETLGPDFDREPDAFVDTAAVMMNLDLIVTSDSAIAHLAGALGRRTWVALKSVPDWRWQLGTPLSPWYPTMRLFRQPAAGDWDGVFAEIGDLLAQSDSIRSVPS
jgi:tetratricopeptide (TPR) repeat protein